MQACTESRQLYLTPLWLQDPWKHYIAIQKYLCLHCRVGSSFRHLVHWSFIWLSQICIFLLHDKMMAGPSLSWSDIHFLRRSLQRWGHRASSPPSLGDMQGPSLYPLIRNAISQGVSLPANVPHSKWFISNLYKWRKWDFRFLCHFSNEVIERQRGLGEYVDFLSLVHALQGTFCRNEHSPGPSCATGSRIRWRCHKH